MWPTLGAQLDVSRTDTVSVVWEGPPQNLPDLNQLEESSKLGMMIALLWVLPAVVKEGVRLTFSKFRIKLVTLSPFMGCRLCLYSIC